MTDQAGRPVGPAGLWLGEDGRLLSYDSVRMTFWRASQRCEAMLGRPFKVSCHTLRHTFAVHMLSVLVREHLRIADLSALGERRRALGEDRFREIALNPLRLLKELLGHRSVETTFGYLTYLADADRLRAAATVALDAELRDAADLARRAESFDWDGAEDGDAEDGGGVEAVGERRK